MENNQQKAQSQTRGGQQRPSQSSKQSKRNDSRRKQQPGQSESKGPTQDTSDKSELLRMMSTLINMELRRDEETKSGQAGKGRKKTSNKPVKEDRSQKVMPLMQAPEFGFHPEHSNMPYSAMSQPQYQGLQGTFDPRSARFGPPHGFTPVLARGPMPGQRPQHGPLLRTPYDPRQGPPHHLRSGPPPGPRPGPPHDPRAGPPPGQRSGPPAGPRPGPPHDPRSGPPHNPRPGPPPGQRSGPPAGPRPGPPHDPRSGPPHNPRPGPPPGQRSGPHPGPRPRPCQFPIQRFPHDPRCAPQRGPKQSNDPRTGPPGDPRIGPSNNPKTRKSRGPRSGSAHGPRSGPHRGARSGSAHGPRSGPSRGPRSGSEHSHIPGSTQVPRQDHSHHQRSKQHNNPSKTQQFSHITRSSDGSKSRPESDIPFIAGDVGQSEADRSEEYDLTSDRSEEHGLTSDRSEEYDLTSDRSEEHGLTSDRSEEHGLTSDRSEEHGLTSDRSEEHGLTSDNDDETTSNVSEVMVSDDYDTDDDEITDNRNSLKEIVQLILSEENIERPEQLSAEMEQLIMKKVKARLEDNEGIFESGGTSEEAAGTVKKSRHLRPSVEDGSSALSSDTLDRERSQIEEDVQENIQQKKSKCRKKKNSATHVQMHGGKIDAPQGTDLIDSNIKPQEDDTKTSEEKGARKKRPRKRNKKSDQEEPNIVPCDDDCDDNVTEKTEERNTDISHTDKCADDIPDEDSVFLWILRNHSGRCTLENLMEDSQLMPSGFDAVTWLSKSRRFKLFLTTKKVDRRESLIVVQTKQIRLCVYYNKLGLCNNKNCPFVHICRYYLLGECNHKNCKYIHSLSDEHNKRVSKQLSSIYSGDELIDILRCSTLQICQEYNQGECKALEKFNLCTKLHMCGEFIRNKCPKSDDECTKSHNLASKDVKNILAMFNLANTKTHLLGGSILMSENFRSDDETSKSVLASSVLDEADQSKEFALTRNESNISTESTNTDNEDDDDDSSDVDNGDSWMDVHIHDKDGISICHLNIEKKCRIGKSRCKKHHYILPYLWQIQQNGLWHSFEIGDNVTVEKEYAQASVESYNLLYETANGPEEHILRFDQMTSKHQLDTFPVRRLSTESYTNVDDTESSLYRTAWIWYWLGRDNDWTQYQVDAPPYQDVVETKYHAGVDTCYYEDAEGRYIIDLKRLIQTNLDTDDVTQVRRRPLLISENDVLQQKPQLLLKLGFHAQQKQLPLTDWAPMATSINMPDLVSLTQDGVLRKLVTTAFYKTMDASEHDIIRIFRIQNIKLWEKYSRKAAEMEVMTHLLGDANEQLLFHGTDSQEVIRGISQHGFDWRLYNKSTSKYGDGSYFAKDAKYSDSYSKPSDSGHQFMFLAKVLVGKFTTGSRGLRKPPKLDESSPMSEFYDTCVDSLIMPTIFVVFDQDQAYPEFLIEYNKVK